MASARSRGGKKSYVCPVFYIQEELSLYTRPNGRRPLKALLKKMNYVDAGCRTAARHSDPSVTAVSKWKKCKWNKIKQNCFTTPAPASQGELAHLDKCQRDQMAFPQMLEIFCLSLHHYSPLNLRTMMLPRMGLLACSFTIHSEGRFAVWHLC